MSGKPKPFSDPITADELRAALEYDQETGIFTWKHAWGTKPAGRPVGHVTKRGYITIFIGRRTYRANRLAWLYVKGVWPTGQVDHRDRNKGNNAFRNLRDVGQEMNQWNRTEPRVDNQAGFLGVSPHGSGFRSTIHRDGRQVSLGTFPSPQEGHDAYVSAKAEIHAGAVS